MNAHASGEILQPIEGAVVRVELVLEYLSQRHADGLGAKNAYLVALDEKRGEERQSLDMVQVSMR